jgi:hypothetical protein
MVVYGKTYKEVKQSYLTMVNCRDENLFQFRRDEFISDFKHFNVKELDYGDFEPHDLTIIALALKCKGRHTGKIKIYLSEINKGHDGFFELDRIYNVVFFQSSLSDILYLTRLENLSFGRHNLLDSLFYYFTLLFRHDFENSSNYYQMTLVRFEFLSKQLTQTEYLRDTLINLSRYPNDHFIAFILNLFCQKQLHVQHFIKYVLKEKNVTSTWDFYTNIDINYVTRDLLKKDIELINALKKFEKCKFDGLETVFANYVCRNVRFKEILI